ncbi:MAG: hypothetical protein K8I27_02065, partial [Planctomycetes bacterium]|nr:hypothetical protein [Planctomycetota bacterium]
MIRFSYSVLLLGVLGLLVQTVALAQPITTFPYNEDFELGTGATIATGWTQSTADQRDWTNDNNGTTSNPTGPQTGDHNPGTASGRYVYFETSSPVVTGDEAIAISPQFDWSGLPNAGMSFWYHLFGDGMGAMHVDLLEQFNSGVDGANTGANFSSAGATFTAAHIGSDIVISGGGNAGTYTITALVNATTVTLGTAPPSNLTGMTYTHTLLTLDVTPAWTDNVDLWQERAVVLASSLVGGGSEQIFQILIRGECGPVPPQTGFNFLSDMAFDDFTVRDFPANDVGVVSVDTPVGGSGLTATETVSVTIRNFGVATQSNIPVSFTINAGVPVVEVYPGPITGGATDTYTFTATADLSTPSTTYSIVASTALVGDASAANDSASANVRHIGTVTTFPYSEDFEGGSALDWTVAGTTTTWELATPANPTINSAASGVNSWITGATGSYLASENGAVVGPQFDMSGFASDPYISMAVWWEAEFSWDGAVLQSSIDNQASWQNVGALGDPNNWYTDGSISGLSAGSGQQTGWSGRTPTNGSNGWVTAVHELTGLGGQASVFLRIVFGSDTSVFDDGFAFDDVAIGDPAEINVQFGPTSVSHRGTIDVGSINTAAGGTASFDIQSLGDLDLALTGTPPDYVSLVGPSLNITTVTVTTPPSTPIAGGSSSTFTVTIDPTVDGLFNFTVTIDNDDPTPVQFASGADGVLTLATSNFTSATANFVAADVGTQIVISGSVSGNDGVYTILTVNSSTDVTLTTAPAADEGTLAWSHEGSEGSYTFLVTGTAVSNAPAEANPTTAPVSSFAGPTNGPLTQTVAPGATLADASIILTDAEN